MTIGDLDAFESEMLVRLLIKVGASRSALVDAAKEFAIAALWEAPDRLAATSASLCVAAYVAGEILAEFDGLANFADAGRIGSVDPAFHHALCDLMTAAFLFHRSYLTHQTGDSRVIEQAAVRFVAAVTPSFADYIRSQA